MPVLFNPKTNVAENIHPDLSQELLEGGHYEVPLVDPKGNLVSSPYHKANDFIQKGYRQPNEAEAKEMLEDAKFSQPMEQLKTGLEGAASAATLGLSTAIEKGLGVPEENIRKRREHNPGSHLIGELAGLPLGAAMLPGGGALGALTKAGDAAVNAVGLAAAKQGMRAAAVRTAAETALYESGDQFSKMLTHDPEAGASSAIANVGMSAVLGGALGLGLGAMPKLWNTAKETQVLKDVNLIKEQAMGIEKHPLEEAVSTLGVEFPGLMKTATGGADFPKAWAQGLEESFSLSGRKAQKIRSEFRDTLVESTQEALGVSPSQMRSVINSSDFEIGQNLKKDLVGEIKAKFEPINQGFKDYNAAFKDIPMNLNDDMKLAERISQIVYENAGILEKSTMSGFLDNIQSSVKNVKNVDTLRKFRIQIGKEAESKNIDWHVRKLLSRSLQDLEDQMVSEHLAKLERLGMATPTANPVYHQSLKEGYSQSMRVLDELDKRLHLKNWDGLDTFLYQLNQKTPEQVVKAFSNKMNDAGILDIMSRNFPKAAETLRQSFVDDLIFSAGKKGSEDIPLSMNTLFSNLTEKWSPEAKNFALSQESQKRLAAIQKIYEAFPEIMNPSHTARTYRYLSSKDDSFVGGLIGLFTGHTLGGLLAGTAYSFAKHNVPDFIKLSMLNMLSKDLPASAQGFQASLSYVKNMIEGQKAVNKAVKSLFESGKIVLPAHLTDSKEQREKLQDKVDTLSYEKPESMIDLGGQVGYYLPQHAIALSAASKRAIDYLNTIKPKAPEGSLWSAHEPEVSKEQKAQYARSLSLINNPLSVLKYVDAGSITQKDVEAIKTVYPYFYQDISNQIMQAMIHHQSEGKTIPYQQRLGLARFLGSPLEPSMTPQTMLSTQPMSQAPLPSEAAQAQAPEKTPQNSFKKLPSQYQTPQGAREQRQNK